MNLIDGLLNKITMYRLTVYVLSVWIIIGLIYSFFNIFPFDPIYYLLSLALIITSSYFSNKLLYKLFKTPVGSESWLISALILFLVISPVKLEEDFLVILLISVLVNLSKYIFAINKKHLFNPVAIALVLSTFIFNTFPSWWVGNINLLPFIIIGGFFIIKKIKRSELVIGFLITSFLSAGLNNWSFVVRDTTLIFFMSVMLVEPLTTPPTKFLRFIYGSIVGLLFYSQTPETALIIGNIFAYIVSPKYKLLLSLKEKTRLTDDTYEFVFGLDRPINFIPGQYMEFTLDHKKSDSRGNRRYLSLANSPTEKEIRLGVKVGSPPSTFKQKLLRMDPGETIAAGQLIGDFTLPKNKNKKLVLIAGGIGITPYRSMIKHLIDKNDQRDIVLVYMASSENDFVYKDIFNKAKKKLRINTIYIETNRIGRMNAEKLRKEIPDYKNRIFYVSGSHNVVIAFEEILSDLNISKNKIVTDYFPGFA